jgi:hypothetical protein
VINPPWGFAFGYALTSRLTSCRDTIIRLRPSGLPRRSSKQKKKKLDMVARLRKVHFAVAVFVLKCFERRLVEGTTTYRKTVSKPALLVTP